MDKLTITRKQAALKGWETRRDKAKKRSDASRKGWKTRRYNIITTKGNYFLNIFLSKKAKKRSDASRKGWKTRRQKMQEAHTDPLGWECVEGG